MLHTILAAGVLLISLPGLVAAQQKVRFDFRGHQLGDTLWDDLSRRGSCESESDRGQDRTCFLLYDHVGDVETDISFQFLDNKLVRVNLIYDSDKYPAMAVAFREKYGPPHRITHEVLANATGGRFQNETLLWRTHSGNLRVSRYAGSIKEGAATIVSPSGLRLMKQREAEKRKRAKEDL
jgi:hypothetical protein